MESMKRPSTIESRGKLLVVQSVLKRGTTNQGVQEPLIMELQRHECIECWKNFNSAKALHGHMRKHPERSYRGINPPSPSLDVVAPNMAEEPCQITLRKRMKAFYEDWDTETYYEGDGADYETRYWKCMAELDDKNKTKEEEAASVTVVASEVTPKETLTATLSKKMKLAGEIAKSWGHLCDTCGKSFSSPQALGWHKTWHRKTNPTLSLLAASEAKVGEGTGKAKGAYACKFCKKEFPSGQALGGHQRLHWQGATITTLSPTEDLTSSTLEDSPTLTSASITSSSGNEGAMVTTDDHDSHSLDLDLRLRL